jgi:NAD(P)H-hydrate epimerase
MFTECSLNVPFSINQLMELAGLSVACSVVELYPPALHPNIIIIAGMLTLWPLMP